MSRTRNMTYDWDEEEEELRGIFTDLITHTCTKNHDINVWRFSVSKNLEEGSLSN